MNEVHEWAWDTEIIDGVSVWSMDGAIVFVAEDAEGDALAQVTDSDMPFDDIDAMTAFANGMLGERVAHAGRLDGDGEPTDEYRIGYWTVEVEYPQVLEEAKHGKAVYRGGVGAGQAFAIGDE